MALIRSIRRLLFACASVLILVCAAGCGGRSREVSKTGGVWFIHATDPHIFLDAPPAQGKDKKAEEDEKKQKLQQQLDEKALSDMLRHINSLPPDGSAPAFIVLTGDLGVEPCSITSLTAAANAPADAKTSTKSCLGDFDKQKRSDQIGRTADLLGQSPIRDIYLVAGNNDIPNETGSDDGLAYFNSFVDEVQKKIAQAKKDVQLHNLTRCYLSSGGVASDCVADVPNTSYRLIGFPSYSFKNRDTGGENLAPQEKQFAVFQGLVDDARMAGRKVLVVSHIPEMDDPYTLAQQRYAGKPPANPLDKDSTNPRDASSTWNVSKKVLDEWESVLASDAIAGVLAGHLHDSHKEIYRQPYAWSNTNERPRGFSKLYLAPPLSVKNQDTSPIQARGFSLVHLTADRIDPSLYWYDSETGSFRVDESALQNGHRRRFLSRATAWLWHLADSQSSLDRMAILLIAFLAAFLTVVQIFQIPPAKDLLEGNGKTQPPANPDNSGGAKTGDANAAFTPSPFASNFGKTVIAGLGGLAAETVLQSLEGKPAANDKEFYVVWFVVFFFILLVLMAVFRAAVEGFRARYSIVYYSRTRQLDENRIAYWFWNATHWFFSLRVPLLIFLDTFVSLIQGKNQTRSTIFTDKIVEQQRNVISVAESIRTQLNELVVSRLPHHLHGEQPDHGDVRVNISVLSADLSNVFYVATAPGSAVKTFPKSSVAWVSVFTGKIRWYKASYRNNQSLFDKIILYDNSKGTIAGGEDTMFLKSYYQPRDEDYEAFVMFPVPWPPRAFMENHVKGAIHISFRKEGEFKALWNFQPSQDERQANIHAARDAEGKKWDALIHAALTEKEKEALHSKKTAALEKAARDAEKLTGDPVLDLEKYQTEDRMLGEWCRDIQLHAVLRESVTVLGELLRGFNENIYRSSPKAGQS
ncbi:MAG TPA: hypothetical protein VGZ48_07210 [Candidatus Acidoferrales bacterium]|nr:hypothetical protein [Candidatus Acidoferrales bacterium]